jgi:hypothetical protein
MKRAISSIANAGVVLVSNLRLAPVGLGSFAVQISTNRMIFTPSKDAVIVGHKQRIDKSSPIILCVLTPPISPT